MTAFHIYVSPHIFLCRDFKSRQEQERYTDTLETTKAFSTATETALPLPSAWGSGHALILANNGILRTPFLYSVIINNNGAEKFSRLLFVTVYYSDYSCIE